MPAPQCNVLLIDDSIHMVVLVRASLNDPRINLTVCENGKDGIETFKSSRFDLVLMDLQMPGVDGCQATQAMRFWERQTSSRPTPLALLTADSSLSALSKAYESGVRIACQNRSIAMSYCRPCARISHLRNPLINLMKPVPSLRP